MKETWEKKTLFVVGPTGVGKSEFAVQLAESIDGEIVGADAFQIYKGMAILTAQASVAQRARVPHHLVGTVSPLEAFNAGNYIQAARQVVSEIHSRGKIAVICGGSGMYVSALIYGLADIPPAPAELREELARQPLEKLVERLEELDPDALALIDLRNPRRVQRAIEIVSVTGKPFREIRRREDPDAKPVGVFMNRSDEELRQRIRRNVEEMFRSGVEEEVAKLGPVGSTASRAIGLASVLSWLRREISREQCIEEVWVKTCQYAKRQKTWFRRQLPFPERCPEEAVRLIDALMHQAGRESRS